MMFSVCVYILIFGLFRSQNGKSLIVSGIRPGTVGEAIVIIPEDVPMALIGIYGFAPPLRFGKDHRLGFGFRFGNHADLQVMYEFGPQTRTKPLQPVKIRSASYRQRVSRRRPLLELLLRAGLLKVIEEQAEVTLEDVDFDQPR